MTAIGFGARLAAGQDRGGWPGRGFDFSGGTMPPGATFARGSTATRITAAGAIATEPADAPRFDHDPATLALRGLLIEPAATNALVASRDLTQPGWIVNAASVTATTIVETTANTAHYVAQSPAFTAGTTYCLSAVARDGAGAKRYLTLFHQANAFGTSLIAKFDLATGAVVSVSPNVTAGAVPAPGGRWLCAMVATATATVAAGVARIQWRTSDSSGSNTSYAGDGVSAIELTDCQFETGAVATSRIVTTATTATRAADMLTLDWGGRGVPDGTTTVRYAFDDGSTQDVETIVAGGAATVPTTLARPRLRRASAL